MAKRKRLLPLGGTTDDLADLPVLETKAMFPGYPQGYAGGHTYSRPAPIADWHHMAMWLAWGAGLILHLVLIRVMPAGQGRPRQLITMGAWIGFVSTLVTLFPVIATSTCA